MEINLTFVFLGHAVELHLCLGGGKVRGSDGPEHVDLTSEPEHQLGFQPNPEEDTEDDDEDLDDREGGLKWACFGSSW